MVTFQKYEFLNMLPNRYLLARYTLDSLEDSDQKFQRGAFCGNIGARFLMQNPNSSFKIAATKLP